MASVSLYSCIKRVYDFIVDCWDTDNHQLKVSGGSGGALETTQAPRAFPTIADATALTVSGTSAATAAAVTAGKYLLTCTTDICWTQAASPTAVWNTQRYLAGGVPLFVTLANQKVAAITNTGDSGTLFICAVS